MRWRVSNGEWRKLTSEGEGACSPVFNIRSHLPLRGKLGWMTPRVGVKTTLTTERAFRGSCSQARAPFSLSPAKSDNPLSSRQQWSAAQPNLMLQPSSALFAICPSATARAGLDAASTTPQGSLDVKEAVAAALPATA